MGNWGALPVHNSSSLLLCPLPPPLHEPGIPHMGILFIRSRLSIRSRLDALQANWCQQHAPEGALRRLYLLQASSTVGSSVAAQGDLLCMLIICCRETACSFMGCREHPLKARGWQNLVRIILLQFIFVFSLKVPDVLVNPLCKILELSEQLCLKLFLFLPPEPQI